jgi:hypothetical protein
VTPDTLDLALPANRARELLSHDLATSRVRLANWSRRVRSKRKTLDRLVLLQLASSVISTVRCSLLPHTAAD